MTTRKTNPTMKRLLSIAACALLAAVTLTPAASANNEPTHLSDEPAPLSPATDVVFFHTVTPDLCTPLTDGFCLERVERWICPAGLSADALERRLSDLTYNESIAAPAVAYLDTHCALDQRTAITVDAWIDARYPSDQGRPVPAFTG